MKGILGAIALEDRTITPDSKIFCENGQCGIGRRVIHDHGQHGWLDLGGIIEVSSNIGAAKIALGLGSQHYYEGLRAFGVDGGAELTFLARPPACFVRPPPGSRSISPITDSGRASRSRRCNSRWRTPRSRTAAS